MTSSSAYRISRAARRLIAEFLAIAQFRPLARA
jgi:hypothetical protein